MKVNCNSLKLEADNISILGQNAQAKNNFSITIGQTYTVFGLTFSFGGFGSGCFVQILSDNNHLIDVPIVLFETVDNRLSKYWEFKSYPDGGITLWPPSFYKDYYHDDLSEDIPEVVEDFKKVRELLINEYD
ncbi:hypothetical protein D3C80_1529570 [compost metagenome]